MPLAGLGEPGCNRGFLNQEVGPKLIGGSPRGGEEKPLEEGLAPIFLGPGVSLGGIRRGTLIKVGGAFPRGEAFWGLLFMGCVCAPQVCFPPFVYAGEESPGGGFFRRGG